MRASAPLTPQVPPWLLVAPAPLHSPLFVVPSPLVAPPMTLAGVCPPDSKKLWICASVHVDIR
eukprot:6212310-Pleurochrysis_carterae.AAC.2